MAKTFGEGFRTGMSVVADLGQMYTQTSAIFEDRAQRQKAEQVSMEVQKQLESAKLPMAAAQERARATAEEYSKAGEDVPDELAAEILSEVKKAQGEYAMNVLEISMNTMGANLGNKYVTQDMQNIADNSLGILNRMSQEAMQSQLIADRQMQREHTTETQQRAFGFDVASEGIRQQGAMEQIRARGEESRKTAKYKADLEGTAAGKIDLVDLKRATEAVDAELGQMAPGQWENLMEAAGIEPGEENFQDFARATRHQRIGEILLSKYPAETVDLMISPANVVSNQRPDAFQQKAKMWKGMIERLREAGDPESTQTADRLQAFMEKQAKTAGELQRQGDIEAARAELGTTWDGMLGNLLDSMAAKADPGRGMGIKGAKQLMAKKAGEPQEETQPVAQEPSPETPQGISGKPNFIDEDDIPVGATLENQAELDLVESLRELGLLTEEEAKPQLTLKRVR